MFSPVSSEFFFLLWFFFLFMSAFLQLSQVDTLFDSISDAINDPNVDNVASQVTQYGWVSPHFVKNISSW